MNKIIKTLKSVNKLGLVLILAAAGLVVTQSAFKPQFNTPNYGKYSGTGSVNGWIDLSSIPGENQPGGYTCESSGSVCKAYFSSAPTSPSQEPESDVVLGTFTR